jgi:hypothetical protein
MTRKASIKKTHAALDEGELPEFQTHGRVSKKILFAALYKKY